MSNSMDSFLTRIGDVTIERVTPRGSSRAPEQDGTPSEMTNENVETHPENDDSSEDSGGETSEGEQEKRNDVFQADEVEEIRSEGSGDDMDLDETIDSQIGVRMEFEKQQSSSHDDDVESVNILDSLPLEGAPIEGQEVTEADLLGTSDSKEVEASESGDNENEKPDHMEEEDGAEASKRRADSDSQDSAKKKQKKEDGNESSDPECETKVEKKLSNMRRNIREVMDENQLDEATLAAQRQEMERLRRVQEQQRIIREVQRQIAINRQNSKTQTRVISLLQGKQGQGGTTISPSSSASSSSPQVRLPNTVLLKVNSSGSASGSQSSSAIQASHLQRRAIDAMRWQKGRGAYHGAQTSISRVPSRPTGPNQLQQRIRMMTPSVSISPVVPKKEPVDRSEYYSDSDVSDTEPDEALQEKQLHTLRKISGMPRTQKPAKGKDVVTISSSSESSDDDCIVLSDPSGGEETDTEDDPSNSGMHTNDRYNVPDEHGRVLINVGHPEGEPDVFLAPQVARIIKPHQIGGIRFLYDNIVESIERYKTSSGFGCILAHSMGLGKTLQVANFCDVFFRCTTAKTVLCIMPINTLQNWLAEFNMWLPYEDPTAEKVENEANVKPEGGSEFKQEIKEENGSLGDTSNLSSSISTESAQRVGQETQTSTISTDGPFSHQGYETQSSVPSYAQENMLSETGTDQNAHTNQNYHSDMSQNSIYGSNSNSMANFDRDSNKSELDCHSMPTGVNFGMGSHPPGPMYPGVQNRVPSSMYPGLENSTSGSIYSGLEHHPPGAMYPGLENPSPGRPFSGYVMTPGEIKQEPGVGTESAIKKEPEDLIKQEEDGSSTKEEKKDVDKVPTPFSVDAPIGMEVRARHFRLHILNDSHKSMAARARVIRDWQKGGGVLLIGYELYRQLSLKKSNKAKRKRGQSFKDMVDLEEDDKNKGLLDDMHGALVCPGPDLVICDEGHRIKNSHASISLALKQMRTKRRIVLTGYPLQNNLLEYWCMVDFVRPNYLGTKSEFCNMFERPIQNGQCIDSTPQDIRLMRYRAHVLHALLEGFVQRRSHSVLQVSLPCKEEYILLVRMTPHQRKLYDTFMTQVVKTRAVPNPLKAFAVCCKIWNHPDVLYHFLKKRQANEEDDLDLEEAIGEKPAPGAKRSKARQSKGEPKKGKKANATTVKNKPAASVQPNSSSSSTDNKEGDSQHPNSTSGNYQNYPMQMQNPAYPNSGTQGTLPHGYQSYRSNDQTNYYRNDPAQGEFNEFYDSQGQQRYGNQSFQPYAQNSGYTPAQGFQNQTQSFPAGNDQPGGHAQRYPSGPPNQDFRPDQSQGSNYDTPSLYPAQSYPYQDQGRNYPSAANQGPNYPQAANQTQNFQNQVSGQTPNLQPIQDYPSYPSTNQSQSYTPVTSQAGQIYPRNDSQSSQNFSAAQNQTHVYPANQQVQNPPSQNQTTHAYPSGQRSQNPASQNQTHGYTTNQQGQTLPQQNQTHGYPAGQQGQNPTAQNQTHGYSPNQHGQNSTSQNQSGQIYSRNDNQTTPNFTPSQSQTRDYPPDQQARNSTRNETQSYPPNRDQTQNRLSSNYPPGTPHQNQTGQFKGPEDPYWQQNNYSQPYRQEQGNDSYFGDSSTNRYQNNYYPQQSYQNQPYEYNQNPGINSRSNDGKTPQPGTGASTLTRGTYDETNKETASTIGGQSQNLAHNNVPHGTGYSGADSNIQNPVMPLPGHQSNDRGVGTCNSNNNPRLGQSDLHKEEDREKEEVLDKEKEDKSDDEVLNKDEDKDPKNSPGGREDPGIPYDWATELMKGYVPGLIDASAKMSIFFCILEESIRLGDRVLAFSQSLFTLNLVEDFLARNSMKYPDGRTEDWAKNVNYYRLDGSTSALEREKLINEFNANPKIHLFLVSTRAGSLGINLVGANRAIVFDASWNPCHDTQAVCRVYRYGQRKPCFVYRMVTDNCLERKIYDRQISKQGMADRVVDQCNPDAHLSLKEAATLSWDWEEDSQVQDFSQAKDCYLDQVMHCLLERHSSLLTKQPFRHESLLVDRKDKKLSQAEKRLARRGYELEKMAANCSRPSYSYVPGNTATRAGGLQIRAIRGGDGGGTPKPVASVRPMQQRGTEGLGGARNVGGSRWIPAEVWQRQGMSAQEMTLPLDVVIPTNSPDKGSIVLKAGQRVMVLKSPKGIYMQLESGKIIAIRTALKLNQQKRDDEPKKGFASMTQRNAKPEVGFPLRNNSAISIIPKSSPSTQSSSRPLSRPGGGIGYRPFADKELARRPRPVATATAKPYLSQVSLTNQVSLSRLPRVKQEQVDPSSLGENSNSSDGQLRTEQRVEEVRLEDVVAEVASNSEYDQSQSSPNRPSNNDPDPIPQKPPEDRPQAYTPDDLHNAQSLSTQQSQNQQETSPIAEQQCQASHINDPGKTTSLKNYRHNFQSHKAQTDASSGDDIIIEEPTPVQRGPDLTKNLGDSSNSSNTSTTAGPSVRDVSPKVSETGPEESSPGVPQNFPYAQYPAFYDYPEPRARSLAAPYGTTYLPGVSPHSGSSRLPPLDTPKATRPDLSKPTEEGSSRSNSSTYPQPSGSTAKTSDKGEPKVPEAVPRDEAHPTAFSHPTNTRYPGPYPPGPYDTYSQHYPTAPGSSTAYPAGAPGFPAFGGPTYDAEYARVYSAFHGPPPAADPYIHRGYPPPPSTGYYPPFPHPPPPPYPNYSFLPSYPNPNMPAEPQPPAQ